MINPAPTPFANLPPQPTATGTQNMGGIYQPGVSPVTVIVGQPMSGHPAATPPPPQQDAEKPDESISGEEVIDEPEMTPEEKEARDIDEYLWRFRVLKKKYPKAKIPEYSKHSDLLEMKVTYDRTLKELHMDDCINSYQNYVLMSFVAIENGCGWVGIDIRNFAKAERKALEKHREYDKFLIEMGEKSYSGWGMSLPVEIRLILFIVFKVITFFVVKHALGDMFEEAPRRKRKMRGPSISVEEIDDPEEDHHKTRDNNRESRGRAKDEAKENDRGGRQRRPTKLDETD